MIFTIAPTGNSYAVFKDGKRFSDAFYLTDIQAEIAARDMERAYMAGCDHEETVKTIQKVITERCPDHEMMLPCTAEGCAR